MRPIGSWLNSSAWSAKIERPGTSKLFQATDLVQDKIFSSFVTGFRRVKKTILLIAFCAFGLPAQTGEKPVALYSGLGNWSHPIAARTIEAQKYFDQGLALFYGFNRDESLRSFRKAVQLDPGAPMAYWGIAMALGPTSIWMAIPVSTLSNPARR
jgi:hypothetical protein